MDGSQCGGNQLHVVGLQVHALCRARNLGEVCARIRVLALAVAVAVASLAVAILSILSTNVSGASCLRFSCNIVVGVLYVGWDLA